MRILYINHYAGSQKHGMAFRPFYLSREWVHQGHQVRVVASSFSHIRTRQPEVHQTVQQEEIDGVDYVWIRTPPYHHNGVGRFINILTFCFRLWWYARTILTDFTPDLVVASSTYPMDIVPARRIARATGAKLVFEVHDLWPLSPIEIGGMSPAHPFIRLVQWAEDYAYRVSDRVVSLLPMAKDYMLSRGMRPEKFVHIPNGIAFRDWKESRSTEDGLIARIRALKTDGRFVLGYAGTHGVANALGDLLAAARHLQDRPISFVCIGDGMEKAALIRAAHDLQHVHFFPAVAKDRIPSILAEFDALYIGWKDNPLYRFGVSPNKLLDYMAAGRPILTALRAANDDVKAANAGLTVPPEEPDQIAAGIEALMALSPEERSRLGENGRRYVRKHHDFSVLAERFLQACQ